LVAALVGPLLIDWSAYRTNFERHAERVLGHEVRVLGDADVSILPSPKLIFSDVQVGTGEQPLMTVERFAVRIELMPLLSGKISVIDMQLHRPSLSLNLDDSGRLDWMLGLGPGAAALAINPDSVKLRDVEISDGRVELVDARTGRFHEISGVNLVLEARSLAGPFKVEGGVSFGGSPYALRIATGARAQDGSLRIKSQVLPANRPIAISTDGQLRNEEGVPRYVGTFALARVFDDLAPEASPGKPWRAEGSFDASPAKLLLERFSYSHGPQDKPYGISGVATIELGQEQRFDALLSAKQIDLDRTLGQGPKKPADIQVALGALVALIGDLPVVGIPGRIGFDIPGIIIGGGVIQEVRFDAVPGATGWTIEAFSAVLPGQTRIAAKGELTTKHQSRFEGAISLSLGQPAAFASWWRRGASKTPTRIDPFTVEGILTLGAAGIALSELTAQSTRSKIIGSLTWRPGGPERNSAIAADLEADYLDGDQLLAAIQLFGLPGNSQGDAASDRITDIGIHIIADRLIYLGVDARELDVSAEFINGNLDVEKLLIADLAGARISAHGGINALLSAPDGSLQADIQARRVNGIVTLLSKLIPDNDAVRGVLEAGELLAPVSLKARFSATGGYGATDATLTVKGSVGGTHVGFDAEFAGSMENWRSAEISANLEMRNPDGVRLLRQIGLQVLPVPSSNPGGIDISTRGRIADGLHLTVDLGIGGSQTAAEGSLKFAADSALIYEMEARFSSPDLSNLALMAGRVLPVFSGEMSADLKATVSGKSGQFELRNLSGMLGAAKVDGSASVDLVAEIPRIDGNLNVDVADFHFLTEIVLGPDAWSASDGTSTSIWPSASFGPALIDGLAANVKMLAGKLLLPAGQVLESAAFQLQLRPGEIALESMSGEMFGGRASGAFRVKRSQGEALISGNIRLASVELEKVSWIRGGQPIATGVANLTLDFEGTGRSIASVVAGLSGEGAFSLRDGTLRSINPAAFHAVIRAAESGLELTDAAIRTAFAGHLDSGELDFKEAGGVVALARGNLRTRNVSMDSKSATVFVSAAIDLEKMTLRSQWTLKVDPGADKVAGAEPQVGLQFSGPIGAPSRQIDVAPLTAFLTLRAYELEVRRIEIMQETRLERERFGRELRAHKRRIQAMSAPPTDPTTGPVGDDFPSKPPQSGAPPAPKTGPGDDFLERIKKALKSSINMVPPERIPPRRIGTAGQPLPLLPGSN
jgi:uncharacterized protein involved in outer membrane biogenesis